MFLEVYLEKTNFPFNTTDTSKFKEILDNEQQYSISEIVNELEKLLVVNTVLNPEFQVEFIPKSILEYSNFLWHSLSTVMPLYEDIKDELIIKALKDYDIDEPKSRQVKWVFDNWLKTIIDSKNNIILSYLYKYFINNQNEEIKKKILTIIEHNLFNEQIAKDPKFLYFIMNIAPVEAKILISRLKKESHDISDIAQEILEDLS